MSANLPSHFVMQFATNVSLLLQQKGSKLAPTVMTGSHVGKQASPVDQIGAVEATKVTTRFAAMGRVDAPVDRRWAFPTDYDLPQLIDSFDKLRLITDPQSVYVQNAIMALGRAKDKEIIAAFFGTAKTGEKGETNTAFPGGQVVAVDKGSTGATGLNVAKLREAKKLLMAANVDLDSDPLFCPITATQHDNLLAEAQVVSTDFNDKPVLVDGKVVRFMGINFVHTELLETDGSGYRRIPVYAKSGLHLGMWNDITSDVAQRKDLQGLPWQAYVYGTFGATRLEEKKTVEIKCAE